MFFIAVQVIHTPLVLVTQTPLFLALQQALADPAAVIAVIALYLGLLAGLFEEIGRFLVFRYFFRRRDIDLSRENGLAFGAGWGGVESIFVGILVFVTMFSYIALTQQPGVLNAATGIPAEEQIRVLLAVTPLDILPGLFERLMALTLQIAFSILVLAAVISARYSLLVLAVLWHTAVDSFAVFLGQTQGIIAAELSVFVFAVIGAAYLWWQWRRLPTGGSRS